jgi:peptidyl-prolyl cis-trans isomerase SurA
MKIRLYALALAACSVVTLLPAYAEKSTPADFIVAVVNADPITNNDVRVAVLQMTEQLNAQKQPLPPADVLRQTVLERLISERAQLQLAAEYGIRIDDAAVDAAEMNLARQNQIEVAALRERMAKSGVDLAKLREKLRDQLVLTRLREREVESRVRVSDQDVDRYLAEELAKNTDPLLQEINLANILIAVPERASAADVAQRAALAQEVLRRARAGEDFAALAKQYSAADASNGGQLGLRRGDRYPPLFIQAVQTVEVGGIADVVRSGAGFHILKVVDRRAGNVLTKTVIQSRARHVLLRVTPQLTQAMAIARLRDYRARIVSGQTTFPDIARQFSQDVTAAQGGDLGWASPGLFVPEFEEVMNQLTENEISQPVVSRFGVHLIQVTDRRRVDLNPREMRDYARSVLRETRLDEAYGVWARDIRERAFVEFREPPS